MWVQHVFYFEQYMVIFIFIMSSFIFKKEIVNKKILLDNKGNLITEFSGLPLEKVHTVFKGHDVKVIKKLIQEIFEKISWNTKIKFS